MPYARVAARAAALHAAVLRSKTAGRQEEDVVLESRTVQPIVLRSQGHSASTIPVAVPSVRFVDPAPGSGTRDRALHSTTTTLAFAVAPPAESTAK